MNCVPLMSEADARLLYHEIDFASGSGALDGMTRTALHRFLSSVHLTANRRLLIDRVGLYDQVTIECPSGSGRHRELRIVPSAEHGSGRSRLPVLLPAALELLGRDDLVERAVPRARGVQDLRAGACGEGYRCDEVGLREVK